MPASRTLARDLNISRNTVLGAYQRLGDEGFLETREQVGTFVAARVRADGPHDAVPAPAARTYEGDALLAGRLRFRAQPHCVLSPRRDGLAHDLWIGRIDARLFPARAWRSLLLQLLDSPGSNLSEYGEPEGLAALRCSIAAYVGAARGIVADPAQILITSGIQEGLSLLARLLVQPGVDVVIEDPCYRGASGVFASHGARLRSAPVDADGIDTAALPRAAALAYVTPSHQYPLGSTLSLERRRALLDWSHACGAYLVEDDYDSDFYYDRAPLPALKSQDTHDHVVYLGTFSKSVGAGLRLGFMVLPWQLIEPARAAKSLFNNCEPWLEQAVLTRFINEGGFAHYLRRLRRICVARRDHLRAAIAHHLPGSRIAGAESGMHLAFYLPNELPGAAELEQAARAHGVGIYSIGSANAYLSPAGCSEALTRCLLVGYASLSECEISEAMLRVRQALESLR